MKRTITMAFGILALMFMSSTSYAQFDQLFSTIASVGGERPPEGGGGQSGPGGGGGEVLVDIIHNWPASGKMLAEDYGLSWKSPKALNGKSHVVTIREQTTMGDAAPLFMATSSSNYLSIPLGSLSLESGKKYVMGISSGSKNSKEAIFTIGSKADYNAAISTAKSHADFAGAFKLQKLMMKAKVLEDAGFKKEASYYFKKYLSDDKNNAALRKLAAKFRDRVKLSF